MLRGRTKEPPYSVRGRTVFITGAARGIGAATAERLHSKGANVALVGLEPERLRANAERLGQERAIYCEADVTDFDALQDAVEATVNRFGGIDVAIANAGLGFVGTVARSPIEQFERTLAVNLIGVWRTDRAVLPEIERNSGYLLNVASLAAISHAPLMGAYTTAKAGVEALTDALRVELAVGGARAGCAYFGFIDTDLVRGSYAQAAVDRANKKMPAFVRNPAPLYKAIDAIDDGIEGRVARLWAPRWVGPALALRGLIQPISEFGALRDRKGMSEAIDIANSTTHEGTDLQLGLAADALRESGD